MPVTVFKSRIPGIYGTCQARQCEGVRVFCLRFHRRGIDPRALAIRERAWALRCALKASNDAEVASLSAVAVITRATNSHWSTLRHQLPPSLPRQVGDDLRQGPACTGGLLLAPLQPLVREHLRSIQ
jgi:hypothetical protein